MNVAPRGLGAHQVAQEDEAPLEQTEHEKLPFGIGLGDRVTQLGDALCAPIVKFVPEGKFTSEYKIVIGGKKIYGKMDVFGHTELTRISTVPIYLTSDIADPNSGEVIVPALTKLSEEVIETLRGLKIKEVEVVTEVKDELIFNTLREDDSTSHEEAMLRIYQRMRPGNPPHKEKAAELFAELFYDDKRYNFGRIVAAGISDMLPNAHRVIDAEGRETRADATGISPR